MQGISSVSGGGVGVVMLMPAISTSIELLNTSPSFFGPRPGERSERDERRHQETESGNYNAGKKGERESCRSPNRIVDLRTVDATLGTLGSETIWPPVSPAHRLHRHKENSRASRAAKPLRQEM